MTASVCDGTARSFGYDSLGRLSSATNPEGGATGYTYDLNGNLKTRSNGGVGLTNGYDDLNRILSKTYTGTATTPVVTYGYDQSSAGLATNFKGRLASIATDDGYKTDLSVYDSMGRVRQSLYQVPGSSPYAFGYTYNFGGGLEVQTNPSNLQVKTCYDGAGRIASVQGKANGASTYKDYAGSMVYAAHGPATSVTLGSNAIVESAVYDPKRLQMTSKQAGALL